MKKILIYNSGGGIGDAVQIINLLISLHDHYKDHEIYLLQAHQNYLFDNKKNALPYKAMHFLDVSFLEFISCKKAILPL